ncbi:MAG: hypothetical protein IJY47_07085 [Clostridia bacterium]|nr:hypothetical protein [Clostridia bacterium]
MSGELLKLCGVAVLCAMVGLLLAKWQREYSALVRVGGTILVGIALLGGLREGLDAILGLVGAEAVEPYADVMLRALGIALLTRLCGEICRECGAGSVAVGVELAGKISILVLCIPLIREILELANEILRMQET